MTCVLLNNDLAITSSWSKTACVWDIRTGRLLFKLQHSSWCTNLDINREQSLLAVSHDNKGGVAIWSLENFTQVADVKLGSVNDVRFLDDKRLVTGNQTGHVNLITIN